MGLLDEIEAAAQLAGPRLKVDVILEELDREDREALLQALNDPHRYASRQIVRALRNRGISVSAQAIDNWRQQHDARG